MTENPPLILPGNPADDVAAQSVSQPIMLARAEALLTDGTITPVAGARMWGSNYSILVLVSDANLQVSAIYKPQRGERPLWDFPNGTLCYREVATYEISQGIGWHLVPPTVLREGPHGLGSLQLFVEHTPKINYFNLDDRFVSQLQKFALFDYLVNNTDRKGGHVLLDPRGRLWGIDHGLTLHRTPKLRTVIWEFSQQPIAENLLQDIQQFCSQLEVTDTPLHQKLARLISEMEIAALKRRIRHLLQSKRYPTPGPGPNHPWPPV